MMMSLRAGALAVCVAALALGGMSARAADASATASVPAFELTGFRSAQFGMAEQAVRSAIAKDFPQQAKSISTEANTVEKTKALTLTVEDLVPDSGSARLAYILGYKTSNLVQVNVTWGAQAGSPAKPETLVNTANLLAGYLKDAGYRSDTIVTNATTNDGALIVFRGEDASGHMTVLMLRGRSEKADKGIKFTPSLLQLSYIADYRNPDVYKLEKGKF